MAELQFEGHRIYYDVRGEGKPLFILNGIMMSTKSWEPFVETLSAQNQLIRLDFIDQGQSDKSKIGAYTQDIQVKIVEALRTELKLSKINIVGISYGGEIALKYASSHAEHVDRLALFNTTAYTSPWLAEIGHSWNNIGKTRDGATYYKASIPVIYSPSFYEKRLDWMQNREKILTPIFSNAEFLDAMERLTNSAETYDVRDKLQNIVAPTLIVSADEDYLTPIANQKELHALIKNSYLITIPGVGHASMYEVPLLFTTLVLGFVNALHTSYTI